MKENRINISVPNFNSNRLVLLQFDMNIQTQFSLFKREIILLKFLLKCYDNSRRYFERGDIYTENCMRE